MSFATYFRPSSNQLHSISVKCAVIERIKTLRRAWLALIDWLRPVGFYSQFGEDQILTLDISPQELKCGIYVDVGSNHPTRISNTYRFYRLGARGILIEPNRVFDRLYRFFRHRDIHLKIGIAAEPRLLPFFDNGSTSVSGFVASGVASPANDFLPVLPLDCVLPIIGSEKIFLLSIDVEGMDDQVLMSGQQLLKRVSRVVIEYGDRLEAIDTLLTNSGFQKLSSNSTNGIYKRLWGVDDDAVDSCEY